MKTSENFYERNIKVIERRWPYLIDYMPEEDPDDSKMTFDDGALRYRNIQFHSKFDRKKELNLYLNSINHKGELTLYGISDGALPEFFLTDKTLKKLEIILLNLRFFFLALKIRDQLPWLNDERVSLTLGDRVKGLNNPHFISSPDVSTAEPNCWRLTNRLIEKLNEPYVTQIHKKKARLSIDRIKKNQTRLVESLDVKVLFGSMENCRGLVVGAGPSLEKTIDYIIEITQNKDAGEYCIISVDVATPALLIKGIIPNFIVTLDEKITKNLILKDENEKTLSNTKLLHSLLANTDILNTWPGNRFLFTTLNELELAPAALKKTTCLFSGGSVIHPATDLAIKLGCNRITFFGADFSFPLGQTHALWKNDELLQYDTRGKIYVLNGYHEKIPSTSSFSSYLGYLERFLKTTPGIHWYNSSNIGANIEGTILDPEIIEWENEKKKQT